MKKILSILLCVAMCASSFAFIASAAGSVAFTVQPSIFDEDEEEFVEISPFTGISKDGEFAYAIGLFGDATNPGLANGGFEVLYDSNDLQAIEYGDDDIEVDYAVTKVFGRNASAAVNFGVPGKVAIALANSRNGSTVGPAYVFKFKCITTAAKNTTVTLKTQTANTSNIAGEQYASPDYVLTFALNGGVVSHTHNYVETSTVPATCTTKGSKTLTCNGAGTCDEPTKTEEIAIDANAHKWLSADASKAAVPSTYVAPTCTTKGSQTLVCEYNHEHLGATTEIPMAAHVEVEYYTPATTFREGKIEYKCSVCGQATRSTVIIPVKEVITPVIPAATQKSLFKKENNAGDPSKKDVTVVAGLNNRGVQNAGFIISGVDSLTTLEDVAAHPGQAKRVNVVNAYGKLNGVNAHTATAGIASYFIAIKLTNIDSVYNDRTIYVTSFVETITRGVEYGETVAFKVADLGE